MHFSGCEKMLDHIIDPLEPEKKEKKRRAPAIRNRKELRAASVKCWQQLYEGKLPQSQAMAFLRGLEAVARIWKDSGGAGSHLHEGADLDELRTAEQEITAWEREQMERAEEEFGKRLEAEMAKVRAEFAAQDGVAVSTAEVEEVPEEP